MPSAKADLRIRLARADELPALSDLCLRSKARWGYDTAFLEACRNELSVSPDDLQSGFLRVAERGGTLEGIVHVIGNSLEKLFVDPAAIGMGVGARLFSEAVAAARRAGEAELVIVADPDAVGFYRRMGARPGGTTPSGSIRGRDLPRLVLPLDPIA